MLKLTDKSIKIVIIMIFIVFKEMNRNKKDIFKVPNQTSKDKNYNVWEEKNTSGVINSRLDISEEKISEFENKAIETIQNEIQIETKNRNKLKEV